jgi:hypothetical protein
MEIAEQSAVGEPAYYHLRPLVQALIQGGNRPSEGAPPLADALGFYPTQGGWICDLQNPIDFDLIEQRFQLPRSIRLDRSKNSIFAEKSWVAINGNVR